MNLFSLAMLLAIMPIILQMLVGSLALFKKIKVNFGLITTLFSLILLITIYIGLGLVNDDAINQGVKCGMPGVAFLFFGFILLLLQLLVISIQLIIKKVKKL